MPDDGCFIVKPERELDVVFLLRPISAALLAAGLAPRHSSVSRPGGRLRSPRLGSLIVRETRPRARGWVKICRRC
jgi:hypothetical protein